MTRSLNLVRNPSPAGSATALPFPAFLSSRLKNCNGESLNFIESDAKVITSISASGTSVVSTNACKLQTVS